MYKLFLRYQQHFRCGSQSLSPPLPPPPPPPLLLGRQEIQFQIHQYETGNEESGTRKE